MRKNKSWSLLILIMIVTVLSACSGGSGGESTPKPDQTTGAATPQKPKEPVEIVFYSNNGDPTESFDLRFGDLLRKKFPDYTIKYIQKGTGTNLPDLIAAGTRFDIFFQTIGNFEDAAFGSEIQYDMTDLVKKHNVDLSSIEPTLVDAIKQVSGGKMYALPIYNNNLVMYYNKSLFDKFGVPHPKDGMTWDQVADISKKLTRNDGGTQYIGFAHSPTHSVRMMQLSVPSTDIKTGAPTINTDARWKRFFQTIFLNPVQEAGVQDMMKATNKIPDLTEFVKSKNIAMINYVSSLATVWEAQFKTMDWDFVSMPTFTDLPGVGSSSYPSYWGITKMAANKDAAMEVLNYMISNEFQTELARLGTMPVLKDKAIQKELGKNTAFKDKNWGAIFYNNFAPIPAQAPKEAVIAGIYASYGTKAQIGALDLNTALRQAEEDAKKKIEELNATKK
ncbi:MAG: extracellular solute-binding protein family 1 [Paenibacillus sp.]|jgi:multiple sugar transport system substrate-binding protein|nr:extracellular solute-binding protein family 1 [Paenibacillus sp.]